MSDHPTKVELVRVWLALKDEIGLENVTVEHVLERSGISKGSLYYHFENYNDLIVSALSHTYGEGIERSIQYCEELLLNCESQDDFISAIQSLAAMTSGPETAHFRIARAQILGMCISNAALRTHVAKEQRRLSSAIELLISNSQSKGWIRNDIDIPSLAIFIQAYTFGKIIDDITPNPLDNKAWIDLISRLFESFLIQ